MCKHFLCDCLTPGTEGDRHMYTLAETTFLWSKLQVIQIMDNIEIFDHGHAPRREVTGSLPAGRCWGRSDHREHTVQTHRGGRWQARPRRANLPAVL